MNVTEKHIVLLDRMTHGYEQALLFLTLDDPDYIDSYNESFETDIDSESVTIDSNLEKYIRPLCREFLESLTVTEYEGLTSVIDPISIGRNLYYSQNRHGVGFFDRKELKKLGIGDSLTDKATVLGEVSCYINDNNEFTIEVLT